MSCVNMNEVAVAILAGGASSRMGQDKAGLRLPNNQTLLEYMFAQFQDYFVFSSGHRTTGSVPDLFDSRLGPVAGIISSITWLKDTHPHIKQCVFIPVDLAYFSTKDLARLIAAEYQVAYFKDHPLPLKIEISSMVLDVFQDVMNEMQAMGGYPVYRFIQQFKSRVELINAIPKSLTNINYRDDWDIFLNDYLSGGVNPVSCKKVALSHNASSDPCSAILPDFNKIT